MSDANFDIIFLGQLQLGHTLAEVKPRLMQLFKVDAAKIDALLSGPAVPLKRNLDQSGAKKYQTVLARAGIKVQIRASSTPAAAVKPDAERVRTARLAAQAQRRAKRTVIDTARRPMSMSERLASEESQLAPVPSVNKESPTAAPKERAVAENGLTIAAVGADVLTASERHRVTLVSVDTSALSLRAGGGDLLDSSERAKEVHMDLDLGHYELAATGEDLLQDDEKRLVEAVSVDIGGIEMAPVGSDMGQLKDERSPLEPDTSKISLAP